MSTAKKHHYIPSFYLKQWAGEDSRLCQYTNHNNRIVCNRKHPNALGFERRLYELRGYSPELAQQVEENFFRFVDNEAACALSALKNEASLDNSLRSAWARFILSLLLRGPQDIIDFRKHYIQQFYSSSSEAEASYNAVIKDHTEYPSFASFLKSRPEAEIEKSLFEALIHLIDNEVIGTFIINMEWRVVDTRLSRFKLLTSDQPVVRSNGLKNRDGHIAISVGPDRLFIASTDKTFVGRLNSNPEKIVRVYNEKVVGSALKYVYGSDDTQRIFVGNRISKFSHPRFMQRFLQNHANGDHPTQAISSFMPVIR